MTGTSLSNLSRACVAVLLCLASCASVPSWSPFGIPDEVSAARAPEALERAQKALADKDAATAVRWARAGAAATGLTTELRDQLQSVLEEAAETRIAELSVPGSDPEGLEELVDLKLPRQLSVTAGVSAARLLIAAGEPYDAYEVLRRLDKKFPLHYQRVAAADLMCEIGLSFKDDDSGFFGWFETVDEAEEILEYVVLEAPWATRCDEAFAALVDIYAKDREWDLAVERAQGLVLNHPQSRLRAPMQARIPRLRLDSIASPEYDRDALLRARTELQEWLATFPGHELERAVRLDLADCSRRLCDNDLLVSAFYERVGNVFGARRHAERAIEEAREAGDVARGNRARARLESLPLAEDPTMNSEKGAP